MKTTQVMLTLEYLIRKIELLKANPLHTVLVALISLLSSYILPTLPFVVLIGFLLWVDFKTGCKKSRRNNIPILSGGWRRSASKMADYSILILSSHLIEVIIFKEIVPVLHIAAGVCAVIEFKSIGENIADTTGNSKILKIAKLLDQYIFPNTPTKPKN